MTKVAEAALPEEEVVIIFNQTKGAKMKQILLVTMAILGLSGCGVQSIPEAKNATEAATAEVTNQYKRREDLIPNLVNVVKGYAQHEEETLEGVIAARAKASQINLDPSKASPEQVKAYTEAQGGLSQALGRLMVVSEKYPDLKANEQFRDLQSQLEGTENRIAVARNRLIATINSFNNEVTVPPTSWTNALFYHYEKMKQWDVSPEEKSEVEKAPEVKF